MTLITKKCDDEKEALENIQDARAARFVEVNIDLANQAYWVATGHTLKYGSILPKVRYFQK